jgi:hypothetical protein
MNIDLYGLSDLDDTPVGNTVYNSAPYVTNK